MAITKSRQIYEVIEMTASKRSRNDKIKVLRDYETMALKDVLRGAYDDLVQWNLPEGTPPYEPAEESSVPSSLYKQHLKFKYFVKGLAGDKILKPKREKLFIDMLESVHPKDAELLCIMKDKKQLGTGITKKLVQEAFPNLLVK